MVLEINGKICDCCQKILAQNEAICGSIFLCEKCLNSQPLLNDENISLHTHNEEKNNERNHNEKYTA